ncbi:hypothetical protein ACFE04_026493 [Oxalis oulophora]
MTTASVSSSSAFLGVDVGTGSARAGLFDDKGILLGSSTSPIQIWKDGDCIESNSNAIAHMRDIQMINKLEKDKEITKVEKNVFVDEDVAWIVLAGGQPLYTFDYVENAADPVSLMLLKLKEPKFEYVVDMYVAKLLALEPRCRDFIDRLEPEVGLVEHLSTENVTALVLAELGANVTLIERGQPVERRGRDIGALVVRQILDSESNFCFGEGGAGTWSDSKLVMKTLVQFGAPKNILVDGKPHLGTYRLVPLLQNFRKHLQRLGVTIKFGARVDNLVVKAARVVGVKVSDLRNNLQPDCQLSCEAVIMAVGHSAQDVYQMFLSHNINLLPKDFAVSLPFLLICGFWHPSYNFIELLHALLFHSFGISFTIL